MKILLMIISQVLFCLLGYSQIGKKDKIIGEYVCVDSSLNAGMHSRLSLYGNGTYKYETGTHMEVYHAYGAWKLNGDTVVVNSSINAKNIPITIREKRVDSLKNHLTFSLVKNLEDDIMGALLYFNKDTVRACDPLLQDGCVQEVGSIRSVKIKFSGEASTKWYKLKNRKANLIEIVAKVHDVLALYIFMQNEQYLYKDGMLIYLPKDRALQGHVLRKLK